MKSANVTYARETDHALNADNADTVDSAHASQTPTVDTIPIAESSGQPLIAKGWLPPYAMFRDKKAQGVDAGAAVVGWNTRDLNDVHSNEITGASLSSNQVTLPTGSYMITCHSSSYNINATQLIWYNVTDSAEEIVGCSSFSGAVGVQLPVHLHGIFTIAAQKVFELRQYVSLAHPIHGLGLAVNVTDEIYSVVMIEKRA